MLLFVFTPRAVRRICNWLLFASLILAGVSAYADLTTGLVAHYPFNGNTNDESGNDNNGIAYGATLIADRFGNTDSAYSFNGIDNCISISDGSQFNLSSTMSISLWVKPAVAQIGYAALVDKSHALSTYGYPKGWSIQQDGAITNRFIFGGGNGTTWASIPAGSGLSLIPDQWNYLTVTRAGNIEKYYLNGNINSTVSSLFAEPFASNNELPLTIGALSNNSNCLTRPFNGDIDDVRIYNRTLYAADIQELYQEGKPLLTVSKQGNGSGTVTSRIPDNSINCGNDCSENYISGTEVTLYATPTGGSIFAGWSGSCTTTSPTSPICSVTMDTDTAVTATFSLAPKPDFTITVITIAPVAPITNGTVTVTVTVKNQDAAAADGGMLRLWANKSAVQICAASGGDANQPVGTLAAGASKTFTKSIAVGAGGIKTLRAFVDATCARVESNETNNQRTLSYRVTNRLALSDFVVTAITLSPSTPTVNGTFMAFITVKNQGTVANLGGYLDVWINSATDQTCGAVGNFWVDVGSIAAGATKAITINSILADVVGTKTLRAFVDSWCETAESNEVNNQFTKTYSVQ